MREAMHRTHREPASLRELSDHSPARSIERPTGPFGRLTMDGQAEVRTTSCESSRDHAELTCPSRKAANAPFAERSPPRHSPVPRLRGRSTPMCGLRSLVFVFASAFLGSILLLASARADEDATLTCDA